jgi:hypothetical protein
LGSTIGHGILGMTGQMPDPMCFEISTISAR